MTHYTTIWPAEIKVQDAIDLDGVNKVVLHFGDGAEAYLSVELVDQLLFDLSAVKSAHNEPEALAPHERHQGRR